MSDFTEEQALKLEKPLDKFLVKLEDNTYGVKFNGFRLRDANVKPPKILSKG